jgi:hypothetical protein
LVLANDDALLAHRNSWGRGYSTSFLLSEADLTMTNPHLSIRLDFANGDRIGPGKIALLEAIQAKGSITAAALDLGMSYRRAWLFAGRKGARRHCVDSIWSGGHQALPIDRTPGEHVGTPGVSGDP